MKRRARIHALIVAAAGCSVSLLGQQADQVPKTYGISQESVVRIGPMQFAPVQSTTPYSAIGSPSFTRYATGGDGAFVASPSLPSGAFVTFVQFDVCDINVADDISVFIASTDNLGQNLQILNGTTTSGTTGCATSQRASACDSDPLCTVCVLVCNSPARPSSPRMPITPPARCTSSM